MRIYIQTNKKLDVGLLDCIVHNTSYILKNQGCITTAFTASIHEYVWINTNINVSLMNKVGMLSDSLLNAWPLYKK